MNKKGQAAVILLILIPVFIVITTIIVDSGINMYNEKKHKNVTVEVINYLLNMEEMSNVDYTNKEAVKEKIVRQAKRIYEENEITTEHLYIEITYGNRIELVNSHIYYSFMNSLFNKGNGNRQISLTAQGYKENEKIVVTFEGDPHEY